MRTNLLREPLRLLALAAFLLGLATSGHAFTLISFDDPMLKKLSVGTPPADGPSQTSTGPRYSVSDNGCFVVFTSTAKNLIPGQSDGNGASDVFLYDICTDDKVAALVSHADGAPLKAGDGASDQPVISPDGEFVVFRSTSKDLIGLGTSFVGQANVFLWERQADKLTLVSRSTVGVLDAANGPSQNGVISRAAGRILVAFQSVATNLVLGDDNGVSDIFRYSLTTGLVNIVSVPNAGLPIPESNGGSVNPVIDSSGDCVVYQSLATNLVSDTPAADDTNGAADVFRWLSGAIPTTILLSHQTGKPNAGRGAVTGSGASTEPSVADNCQRFAFKSGAKDLVAFQADGNGGNDVFHARNTGDAALASHGDGAPNKAGDDVSDAPILSRDGNWIAYASRATDLSPGQTDSGGSSDVFLYDVAGDKNTLASHTAGDPKKVASGESFNPEISNDGLYLAFASDAKDIDPNQNDGNGGPRHLSLQLALEQRRRRQPALRLDRDHGNSGSIGPALSGSGYAVAFTSRGTNLIADDPETAGFDDVFYFRSLGFVWPFISARSTENRNTLEWITPATNYVTLQLKVTSTNPCNTLQFSDAAWTLLGVPVPPANSSLATPFTDPIVYPTGTTRCYGIFVQRDNQASIPLSATPIATIEARTLEAVGGPVKWAANVADVTALAQVGIGAGNVIAVANDGGVYALNRGATGGLWSSNYRPFRTDFKPIQGRPPVLTMSVMGATHTTFVGSQDGRVYAFDADSGARVGGALWYTSPALASTPRSRPSSSRDRRDVHVFGGVGNHLFVGAEPTTGPRSSSRSIRPPDRSGREARSRGRIRSARSTRPRPWTTPGAGLFREPRVRAGSRLSGASSSRRRVRLARAGARTAPPESAAARSSGAERSMSETTWAGLGLRRRQGSRTGRVVRALRRRLAIKSFVFADRQGTGQDLYYATTTGRLCAR
jgi:Tol biopolymer transport system component